jgi:hypothetical protein
MSYTRSARETISGTAHGRFSYPASEHGGTESVSLDWEEDINIQVTVDDDPFRRSVDDVKNHIDVLTTSVVATEAAQLVSKKASADNISDTVVKGFFGLIRGEISQQMMQLAAFLPPKLLELNNMANRCVALRQQMEQDFARISGRYNRLFNDLDNELKLRIQTLDRMVFSLHSKGSTAAIDAAKAANVTTPMITGQETQSAQAQLLIYTIRQRVSAMIHNAQERIGAGEKLNEGLRSIVEDLSTEKQCPVMVPVIIIEQSDPDGGEKKRLLLPQDPQLQKVLSQQESSIFNSSAVKNKDAWAPLSAGTKTRIDDCLSKLIVQGTKNAADVRSQREVAMIKILKDKMNILTLQGEAKP